MADEEPESFIDKMTREVSLPLRVVGGRVFVENADSENIDRCLVELKCYWEGGLLDDTIRIGEDKHKPLEWDEDGVRTFDRTARDEIGWQLQECPILLSFLRVDESDIAASAAKNDGKPILGRFNYYAPIQTADGVVNDEHPSITAWACLGAGNFDKLCNRLMATEEPDFEVRMRVEFPRGSVTAGHFHHDVVWDGKGQLSVCDATIVWKQADWNSDTMRERRAYREPEPVEYVPPQEHVELMQAIKLLEARLAKLATPVWIAAAAAIAAVFFAR